MSCPEVCRACLSSDLKLYNMEDLTLLDLYEKLTSFQLITPDSRPDTLCYICLWQLQRCARFSAKAERSEKYLRDLLVNNVQMTQETFATLNIVSTLSTVKLQPVTLDDDSLADMRPSFETAIKEVKIEFSDSVLPNKEVFTKKEEKGEILMEEVKIPTEENMTIKKENSHRYCEKTHIEQCDERFSTASGLNGHNMSIHTGGKPYYCSNCKIGYEATDTYRRHMDLHRPYACSTCPNKFQFACGLQRHMSIHGEAKPFACSQCDMTFKEQCGLKKHMLTHTDDKPYLCWCKKSFRCSVSLRRHMLTHTKHKCDICNVTFDKTSSLNKHKKDHKGGRPYYCEKCDLEFSMLSMFALHMSKHSKPTVKQQNIRITKLPKSKNQSVPTKRSKIQSPRSKQSKSTEQNKPPLSRTKHSEPKVQLNQLPILKSRTKNRPICPVCKKQQHSPSGLLIHMRIHTGEKPFACTQCGRAFRTRIVLDYHMRTRTGEKVCSCEICGVSFSQFSALKQHSVIHTGQVPYACHLCDKAYKQSGQLSEHIRNLHQGVRYICDLCNGRFTLKQHLKRHIKAHAGIKPYTCVKCTQKLSTLSSLKRHMKNSCSKLK